MLFSVLSFTTLEAIKIDALEVLNPAAGPATDEAKAVAETLIASVDAECERRIVWAETVQEALEATGTLTGAF